MLLIIVLFESLGMVSYSHSTATMAASSGASTQYMDVIVIHTVTARQQRPRLCMHRAAKTMPLILDHIINAQLP